MGMFDTFVDSSREGDRREAQNKAFRKYLETYYVGDEVTSEPSRFKKYYVQTTVPFRFIYIENHIFKGIFDIIEIYHSYEDHRKEIHYYDYYGNHIAMTLDYYLELYTYNKLWECYINNLGEKDLPFFLKDIYNPRNSKH